jgi:hypothetical protein
VLQGDGGTPALIVVIDILIDLSSQGSGSVTISERERKVWKNTNLNLTLQRLISIGQSAYFRWARQPILRTNLVILDQVVG